MTTRTGGASLWQSLEAERYPALARDLAVEVLVVGAGITGLTAATLLQRAGKSVAVVELHRVAGGETGHTTAHLTQVVDSRYHQLVSRWGLDGAKQVAASSRAAIEQIAQLSKGLDCDFRRVPAFLYAERAEHVAGLEKELHHASECGLDVSATREVPLPFEVALAMRVEDQARIHPRAYLLPLARALVSNGGHLFEHTKVVEVRDGAPCVVTCQGGARIEAREVVVAANVPMLNRLFLHTKLAAYRTYAVAGRAQKLPPAGLYWDTEDPYHYTRTHSTPGGEYLIVGGEDHKTGQADDTVASYRRLERYAKERFGLDAIEYRWSGQVIEPVDGLPFIGKNSGSEQVQVATGFSGNGMTYGTLAGMIVSDAILGKENAWAALYAATRVKSLGSVGVIKDYVAENLDYPSHLVGDRLARPEGKSLDEVPRGEGRILELSGKKTAVYRDDAGSVHALSPVCPHLGCHVKWNTAEKSWDCPCHGGRFDACGKVLNGPPTADLSPAEAQGEAPAGEEEKGTGQATFPLRGRT